MCRVMRSDDTMASRACTPDVIFIKVTILAIYKKTKDVCVIYYCDRLKQKYFIAFSPIFIDFPSYLNKK